MSEIKTDGKRIPFVPQQGSRLTLNETIYYQPVGEDPKMVEDHWTESVKSDEQLYQRNTKVGPEWKRLDIGWIDRLSLLHVANVEGKYLQVQPTPEELDSVRARVVEIAYDDSQFSFLVIPGQSLRIRPSSPKSLRIRCTAGEAKVIITVFPG